MWTLDNKRIEWDRVTVMEVKKNKRDTKVSVKGDETWKKILAHV